MKSIVFSFISFIAANNPEGFTVNSKTFAPIKSGYAVAVADTQNSFGDAGLQRVIDYAYNHKEINAIGGWLDSETGLYYFDATVIFKDLEEAKLFAAANNQIAIFDLDNLEEIRL